MAVISHASGTSSQTVGTEFTLADISVSGTFTLHVDLSAMLAGDTIELRVYQMIAAAGTRRVAYVQSFSHQQPADNMIAISVPISNDLTDTGAVRFTLYQRAGTTRALPWKVLRYI